MSYLPDVSRKIRSLNMVVYATSSNARYEHQTKLAYNVQLLTSSVRKSKDGGRG
jgi:hypothetical protein